MAETKVSRLSSDMWDYRVIEIGVLTDELAETALADLGIEHWELVAVDAGRAYFKRKRRPPPRKVGQAVGGKRPTYEPR
jgi:hypothetical protein